MFWNVFYELCVLNNTKPNNVCSALGLSTATATSWKKGSSPNGETLLKLSDYFNVSVDYLLTGKEHISDNRITGNNNFVQQGNISHSPITIKNGTERELTEPEIEMLKIYNSLTAKEKAQMFLEICKYDKEDMKK